MRSIPFWLAILGLFLHFERGRGEEKIQIEADFTETTWFIKKKPVILD